MTNDILNLRVSNACYIKTELLKHINNNNLTNECIYIASCIEKSIYTETSKICKERGIFEITSDENYIFTYKNFVYNITDNFSSKYLTDSMLKYAILIPKFNNKNAALIIEKYMFSLPNIASMTPYQLNPECNKDIMDLYNKRLKEKIEKKYSTMYTCNRCKSNKCSIKEQQIRRFDEGKTVFITCSNCQHVYIER